MRNPRDIKVASSRPGASVCGSGIAILLVASQLQQLFYSRATPFATRLKAEERDANRGRAEERKRAHPIKHNIADAQRPNLRGL
jgi:hypothetical protein